MLATSTRRRPLGRTIVHVAIVLALAFGLLAGAGGYWAVVRSTDLARSPYDPAVIAAARTVPRGRIIDREGHVLVRNKKDANGEFYRSYSGEAISHVLGYASTRYGKAGLELAYDAELSGPGRRSASPTSCASSAPGRTTPRTCSWRCHGTCSAPP